MPKGWAEALSVCLLDEESQGCNWPHMRLGGLLPASYDGAAGLIDSLRLARMISI